MAENKKDFDIEKYYKAFSRVFKGGSPIVRHRIASKISPPGLPGTPIGTAKAFLKSTTNLYASQMSSYGMYSRLARYSDYSEMDSFSVISSALDIYSDEICTQDEYGNIVSIHSSDATVRKVLESLFYDVLNLDFHLWTWVRNLNKYGDQFLMIDHHPDYGVMGLVPMPVNETEREEGYDPDNPLAYRFRWVTQGNRTLEPWQVSHFRILGNDNFSPYGSSTIEAARRTFRQLCCSINTKIFVDKIGWKPIQDVCAGDVVISFDIENKKVIKCKVKKCVAMGIQPLVEVRTEHRKIKVTPNHGLLVFDPREEKFIYKQAKELNLSSQKGGYTSLMSDKLVLPTIDGVSDIQFDISNEEKYYVKLKQKNGYEKIGVVEKIKKLQTNTSYKNIHEFLQGNRKISLIDFRKIKDAFNIQFSDCILYWHINNKPALVQFDNNFELHWKPKNINDFVRFFGFMLGDGWITGKQKGIGIALGIYPEMNEQYLNLMRSLEKNKKMVFREAKKNRGACVVLNSSELANIFCIAGFRTGFANKNIPSWVFGINKDLRFSFIQGLMDADGADSGQIQLANKKLIQDLQHLCYMTGISVGKIGKEKGKEKIIGGVKTYSKDSYRLFINLKAFERNKNKDFVLENAVGIKECDPDETYDLEVDHPVHNFTANGVISHNTLLEDAVMVYRIVRSPERRIFYIDVGGIDPNDVPQFIEKVKTQLKRNQVVDSTRGQLDLRFAPQPIHKDSLVPLLDGRTLTIENVAKEYEQGKENWVYSIHDKNHNLLPGKVIWCGKNYTANKLVKIILDDDTFVTTAPEHPFILRDGTYRRADELKIGDSLMAIYRSIDKKGYEKCYDPSTDKDVFTHRFVAQDIYKNKFGEKYTVVHHKEFQIGEKNKLNNDPRNLEIMNFWEHRKLHAVFCNLTLNSPASREKKQKTFKDPNSQWNRTRSTEEFRNSISENNRKRNSVAAFAWYNGSDLHKRHNEVRKNAQLESWEKNRENRIIAMKKIFDKKCFELFDTQINEFYKNDRYSILDLNKITRKIKNSVEFMSYFASIQSSKSYKRTTISRPFLMEKIRELGFKDYKQYVCEKLNIDYFAIRKEKRSKQCTERNIDLMKRVIRDEKGRITGFQPRNHKVKDIICMNDANDDVYCMTVVGPNGEENRHNFAVATSYKSLILLKNTITDDYYLPVRGEMTSTRIETLPGGQYVGDIEDLNYHLNKLFAALKIPKSYLGYEAEISNKASLTQEDVSFARTIARLQKIVVAELNKVAIIHLYSIGYRNEDLLNFEISMTTPSIISEIQRLELWRTKFEVSGVAREGDFDRRFVYQRLFKLTDEDIEEIEEGKRKDRLFDLELESMQTEAGMPAEGEPVPGEAPPGETEPPSGISGIETPPAAATEPIEKESRDPNRQRAIPNELRGKRRRRKDDYVKRPTSLLKHAFHMKKNALDPRDDLVTQKRSISSPFGESKRILSEIYEGSDLPEKIDDIVFQSKMGKFRQLTEQLEKAEIFQKKQTADSGNESIEEKKDEEPKIS